MATTPVEDDEQHVQFVNCDHCNNSIKMYCNHSNDDRKTSKGNGEVNGSGNNNKRFVRISNPNILDLKEDNLYHLSLNTRTNDMQAMFGDVKFVCVGGSPRRMKSFAHYLLGELHYTLPAGQTLVNIANTTDRYAVYKVGPVLTISHGIGHGSISVVMNEIVKALHYAKATDVCFIRMGTSGGLGIEQGSVVLSDQAVDGLLRPYLEVPVLGKIIQRPTILDKHLNERIMSCLTPDDNFKVVIGKTMCTLDFYEGQARLDGAFCDYTPDDKMGFLREVHRQGVRNIEMESLCFAAMCTQANVPGAVVCVALLDRFNGDQLEPSHEKIAEWEKRPALLVARLIRKTLLSDLSDASTKQSAFVHSIN